MTADIIVAVHHGAGMCQLFALVHQSMPGTWIGIDPEDIRNLTKGPGDTSTAEGWMQDKLYDAAWIEVCQNARYIAPDGRSFSIEQDSVGNLILSPYRIDEA